MSVSFHYSVLCGITMYVCVRRLSFVSSRRIVLHIPIEACVLLLCHLKVSYIVFCSNVRNVVSHHDRPLISASSKPIYMFAPSQKMSEPIVSAQKCSAAHQHDCFEENAVSTNATRVLYLLCKWKTSVTVTLSHGTVPANRSMFYQEYSHIWNFWNVLNIYHRTSRLFVLVCF